MPIQLEVKEFNLLRHRVATGLAQLERLSDLPSMGAQALRGLALMKEDGRKVKDVLDAAAKERALPESFVVEVENWIGKVEEIASSLDADEETSR